MMTRAATELIPDKIVEAVKWLYFPTDDAVQEPEEPKSLAAKVEHYCDIADRLAKQHDPDYINSLLEARFFGTMLGSWSTSWENDFHQTYIGSGHMNETPTILGVLDRLAEAESLAKQGSPEFYISLYEAKTMAAELKMPLSDAQEEKLENIYTAAGYEKAMDELDCIEGSLQESVGYLTLAVGAAGLLAHHVPEIALMKEPIAHLLAYFSQPAYEMLALVGTMLTSHLEIVKSELFGQALLAQQALKLLGEKKPLSKQEPGRKYLCATPSSGVFEH